MIAKSERLVNLTIALLEARRPLTFQQLREQTGFWAQPDLAAARRMFERDKDELRQLGVPVETRPVDGFEAEVGYVVERRDYELADVSLTREEMTALALALQVAGDATSRTALAKVGARAPDPEPAAGLAAHADLDADPLDHLAEALVERSPIRFAYRGRQGVSTSRTVDPYAVVYRRGAWYLVGHDHARDDLRVFRLDRFDDRPERAGPPAAFEPPGDLDAASLVGRGDATDALIAVAASAAWEAELHGGMDTGGTDRGRPVYRFTGASSRRLRAWVLGLGVAAEVLEPAGLREQVIERLRVLAGEP